MSTELAVQEMPLMPALSPEGLIAKALEHNVSVDALERLLALRATLKAEQARAAFFAALSRFQAACPIIGKTKTVTVQTDRGTYKYNFAPLDKIIGTIQPLLEQTGLSFTFNTAIRDNPPAQMAICTVHHIEGHSEFSEFTAPVDATAKMNVMQKNASAQTYAKRYALCNALGILTGDDDDDANATAAQKYPALRVRGTTAGGGGRKPEGREGSGETGSPAEGDGAGPAERAAGPAVSGAEIEELEKQIRKLAEAFYGEGEKYFDKQMDQVKQAMMDRFNTDQFSLLIPEQFAVVKAWVEGRQERGPKGAA
jgi:hypothetical protein